MDFGGIFRNLFKLSPSQDTATTTTTPSAAVNPDVYDDTNLAIFSKGYHVDVDKKQGHSQSKVEEVDDKTGEVIRSLPSFRDIEGRKTDRDQDGDDGGGCRDGDEEFFGNRRRGGGGGGGNVLLPGSNMIFGDLFSFAREMFGEMERAMGEMDDFFKGQNDDDGFTHFDFNFPQSELYGPTIEGKAPTPGERETSRQGQGQGLGNYRHHVLKREDVPRPPVEERVDQDFDELYKNSKLDLSGIPVISPPGGGGGGGRGRSLEEAWNGKAGGQPGGQLKPTVPLQPTNRFQYSYTVRQYKSSPDGTVSQGKTIRETNEGREITTYRRNERGEVEEDKEFIPSEPGSGSGSGNFGSDSDMSLRRRLSPGGEPSSRFSLLQDFFFPPRPRM